MPFPSSSRGRRRIRVIYDQRGRYHQRMTQLIIHPPVNSLHPRFVNGEIRLNTLEPIPPHINTTATVSGASAGNSSVPTPGSSTNSTPTFNLKMNPYRIPEFEATLQSYVAHLDAQPTTTESSGNSTVLAALAEKVYLDNYRILSVLIIDAALIPKYSVDTPIPAQPALVPADAPTIANLFCLIHFTHQTSLRNFFVLKGKPYAVHVWYHRQMTFEFDYSAAKFQGPDAQHPEIFSNSIVEPNVKEITRIGRDGNVYPKILEFVPGPIVDRYDPMIEISYI